MDMWVTVVNRSQQEEKYLHFIRAVQQIRCIQILGEKFQKLRSPPQIK